MKKILNKILKKEKVNVSMGDLINCPPESLGSELAHFLFNNSYEPDPVPQKTDIYRLLISKGTGDKEEIAMFFYLFGNGDNSVRTLFVICSGAVMFPQHLTYFYSKYRDGRNAFRFYDLDHFRMLNVPVAKIKDAFRIN